MADRHATMLLVDDDEDMRFLVRGIVRRAEPGISIVDVPDAEAALEVWRAEPRPDVIVTDHRMPGMSGVELAQTVLADEPDAPVILFSAYLDAALVQAAESAGVCRVVDKDRYNDLPRVVWECIDAPHGQDLGGR